jgi:hypothetical protein
MRWPALLTSSSRPENVIYRKYLGLKKRVDWFKSLLTYGVGFAINFWWWE